MKNMYSFIFSALLAAALSVTPVQAASLLIQPGPVEGQDTWIWDGEDFSHGDSGELRTNQESVFQQYILARFDVSSLLPGTTINSATLGLYKYDHFNNAPLDVTVHQVISPWAETVTWSTQPGFNNTAEDTTTVTDLGWYTWDLTNLTQDWVDGVDNDGILWKGTSGTGFFQRFASSDNATGAVFGPPPPTGSEFRPYLSIDYTVNGGGVIPEPASMLLMSFGLAGLAGLRKVRA